MPHLKSFNLKNSLLLLLAAIIWGSAFVAQSVGMDYIGPFTFNGTRSIIGAIVLIPVFLVVTKLEKKKNPNYSIGTKKNILTSGIVCGVIMFVASNLQQFGIQYTSSVGKAGFITALYIVLVPVLGIFIKRSCPAPVWLGVGLALVGLWFLCMDTSNLHIEVGDFLVFLCAIIFAIHILVVDHYSPLMSGVLLSCLQFAVCGILSFICALIFETVSFQAILSAWQSVLYAGILSCGVAYTLQIVGQKNMDPTAASLILSLESCMSVLAGWIVLHQALSLKELTGCALVFIAVIFVQIVVAKYEAKNKEISQ